MKKLLTILAALAILASGTVNAQVAEKLTAHRLDRPWTFSSFVTPSGCVSSSVPFFGADLKLTCDGALTYTTATLAAPVHSGTSFVAAAPATVTITNCTNATPIVCTATAHGLSTNDRISISGITGNTNANGYFKVTRLTADTFSLQNYSTGADIAGNGTYGGTPVAVAGIVQANRVLVGDGTLAAPSLSFAGAVNNGFYNNNGFFTAVAGGVASAVFTSTATTLYNALFVNGTAIQTSPAAATLQLGAANAASPVAQTLKVQDATGTNANAAATFTVNGPAGTGTGTRGDIVFKAPIGASSGSSAHTQTEALRIKGAASGGVPAVVLSATQSPASNAACTAGTITWDASYIYICTASGAWKRAALTGGY